ncbi:MAG: SMP-30/gluconolactonase/LRE family protein [Dehalococcoidia bacterium]|nr:SMP-30/gluconolactonase/LRE family protein [Dehalococcoidia bacterium]
MFLLRHSSVSLILLFSSPLLIIGSAGPVLADEDPPVFVTAWGYTTWSSGQFDGLPGIAVDDDGNVYVADDLYHRIEKFDRDGTYLDDLGSYGENNGQFKYPAGVAVDAGGCLYVADSGNDRVQKFDSDGVYLAQWGENGTGNGEFQAPLGIDVDADGNVYVADTYNDRIQKFDSDGVYLSQWGGPGTGDGKFDNPYSVAVDSEGNVYVVDSMNHRVQKFDSDGNYLDEFGGLGPGNGEFEFPMDVAVDADGNVYVTDAGRCRVQKFGRLCNYLSQWGGFGEEEGEFNYPYGVAVDREGSIFISETRNARIQKFGYVVTVDLVLKAGWNMVSVPVQPEDNAVGEVFPDIEAIYTWDPMDKAYEVPAVVEPRCGYWVAVTSDRTISVEGLAVNRWASIVLAGWNMVGSVCGGTCSVGDASEVSGEYVENFVYCWDPVSKSYQYGTDICPCKGYWAAATDSCVLMVGPPGP